jgi:plasmid stabilization system protein ParE
MADLIWAEKAITSLENIYDYISKDSPAYARRQITEIVKSIERLEIFPDSGRHIPEFPDLPHREVIVNAFRVVYRFESENAKIFIVNIIHGNRLLNKTLLSDT